MCCNYCFHFTECTRVKKTNSDCCNDCAEYEFCPFILNETAVKDTDYLAGENDDIDILEDDEL